MTVAAFHGTCQRVIDRGMLNPAYHGGFRRHPLPANLAAGKLSALKEMVNGVARHGEQGRRRAYVENLGNAPELPAVKWRQINLDSLTSEKRAALVAGLEKVLSD